MQFKILFQNELKIICILNITKEKLKLKNDCLKKRELTYSEFKDLIENYFVKDYKELEDDYYLVKVIRPSKCKQEMYTDYIRIIK